MMSPINEHDDKAEWNARREDIFIRLCHEHVLKGELQTSTFSKKVWNNISDELYNETQYRYSVPQLKSKFNRFRKKHREFSDLITSTGFGWNPDTNTVTASEDIWKEYLKKVPSAKQFKRKGLEHYDMLGVIFNSSTATGVWRFSSRQMPPTLDDDREVNDNFINFGFHVDVHDVENDEDDDPVVGSIVETAKRKKVRRAPYRNVDDSSSQNNDQMDKLLKVASELISQKTSQESRSRPSEVSPPQKNQIQEYIDICENLGGIEKGVFIKFLNIIAKKPDWRTIFLSLSDERRREWLSTL